MHSGRSVRPCTSRIASRSSSASSASGIAHVDVEHVARRPRPARRRRSRAATGRRACSCGLERLAAGRVDALADDAERLVGADDDGLRPRPENGVHALPFLLAWGCRGRWQSARDARRRLRKLIRCRPRDARQRRARARPARRRPRSAASLVGGALDPLDQRRAGTEMPGTCSSMKRSAAAPRTRQIDGQERRTARSGRSRTASAHERLEPLGSKQICSCRKRAPAATFFGARSTR